MAAITLKLSPDEQAVLHRVLEAALEETHVELHRTHYSPSFRENVKSETEILQHLLDRIGENGDTGARIPGS